MFHKYNRLLINKVLYANDAREYAELDSGETKLTLLNRDRLREFIGSTETISYEAHEAKMVMTFTVDNLDEVVEHLKTHAIPRWIVRGMMQGGSITACFRDPDGNLIELEQILS